MFIPEEPFHFFYSFSQVQWGFRKSEMKQGILITNLLFYLVTAGFCQFNGFKHQKGQILWELPFLKHLMTLTILFCGSCLQKLLITLGFSSTEQIKFVLLS